MRKRLQFNLRSLLIIVTLLCVGLAAVAYKLRLLQADSPTSGGSNYSLGPCDPAAVADVIRARVAALPGHAVTQDAVDRLIPSQNDGLRDGVPPFYASYYRVKLPDGAQMHVGFWVYDHPSTHGTKVSYRAYGRDSYGDVKSGAADKRRALRAALMRTYRDVIRDVHLDLIEARDRPAVSQLP